MPSGWSALLRLFMRHLLIGPEGLRTVGVPLMLRNTPVLLFATVTNLLSDGDGLRSGLNWNGANSLRPCLKHDNIVSKRSGLAGDGFVDITCTDHRAMRLATGVPSCLFDDPF